MINEHPEHGRWMASRSNNDGRYNDNRAGNAGRNEVYKNDDRRYNDNRPGSAGRNEVYRNDDRRYDNSQRPTTNNPRFSEGNNQRPADIVRSDRDRVEQPRMNNNGGMNDNKRSNEVTPRDNHNFQDRRDGGRRN